MNPGLLDRIVTIKQRNSANSGGSMEYSFTNLYSDIRAKFITKNGNRSDIADAPQLSTSVEFIINSKDAPTLHPNMQLVMDDNVYRIDAAFEMHEYGRDRYSKIVATLINNNVH